MMELFNMIEGIRVDITWFLIFSALLLMIGVYGFLTRRNTLAILISIELILNAADINFAAFNRMLFPDGQEGYIFTLFSVAISAAETAIAIAVMINIYRNLKNNFVSNLDKLKW